MKIIDAHQHLMAYDPTGDWLVRYLDTNGIEKALVMGVPYWTHVLDNTAVRMAVRRHPDRLIGGFYVDPRDVTAARETIREYHGNGFKVVKMFPCFGFYPDDPAIFPVYELMEQLGLPLLNHTGGIAHDDKDIRAADMPHKERIGYKFDFPWHYDTPARAFPNMNIVLAHMGTSTWNLPDIFFLVNHHPNVYLDTSSTCGLKVIRAVARAGNDFIQPLDFRKLLWGRDGYTREEADTPSPRVREEHQAIRDMVGEEALVALILYENAKRLLRLS